MKPSSAKAKGRVFQQTVAKVIQDAFDLSERDVVSTSMGAPGADVKLSAAAFSTFPHAVECKSVASFVGYTYMLQAVEHAKATGGIPIVAVKANGKEPLVILSLTDYITILINLRETK